MLIGGALMNPAEAVGWWSYAEADSTVLGLVVAALGVAAVAFVATRVLAHVRRRR
jgi:hypothetical protein